VSRPRITWLGHSTVLIELGGVRLLTDPVLRSRIFHLRRAGARPARPRSVDAVLLSHPHYDHLDLPSLRALEPRPRLLCPTGAGPLLAKAGFPELDELLPGASVALQGVHVQATPAEHGGSRRPGGPVVQPLGFLVRGERSVYFAGDTDLFGEMSELGPVDVALLPVAGYSPKLGPGHLDARRAAEAAALVRARIAVPIHWGTFHPITQARGRWFTEPPERFAAYARELAPEVDVRVLSPGESLAL
jgi:L-ascorbate metabolism protein UlaG (beta-lactamase superfamily)